MESGVVISTFPPIEKAAGDRAELPCVVPKFRLIVDDGSTADVCVRALPDKLFQLTSI